VCPDWLDAACDATCVTVTPDEWRALEADAKGPLQTETVAASAQSNPTAIARPGVNARAMEALSSRNVGVLRVFLKKP
jgi:hypothetical protein